MEETDRGGYLEFVEEIVIDFGKICRFCLSETESSISISDKCLPNESIILCEDTISDFIMRMTSIKMQELHNFPSLVCKNCYNIVKVCYDFTLICQQSDASLRDCYQKTLTETRKKLNCTMINNCENIKAKVESEIASDESKVISLQTLTVSDTPIVTPNKLNIAENDFSTLKKEEWKMPQVSQSDTSKTFKGEEEEDIQNKSQRACSLTEKLREAQLKLAQDINVSTGLLNFTKSQFLKSIKGNDQSQFSCSTCSLTFHSYEVLKLHCTTSHSEMKQLKSMVRFHCRYCIKSFPDRNKLSKHYKSIHHVSDLVDENMSHKYSRKKLLADNSTSQTGSCEEASTGQECDKETGEQLVYSCGHCTFDWSSDKSIVVEHLKICHSIREEDVTLDDIKCQTKEKNSQNVKFLKVFACTLCSPPVSFTSRNDCFEHGATTHGQQSYGTGVLSKELPVVCTESHDGTKEGSLSTVAFCDNCQPPRRFTSIDDIVSHMSSEHPNEFESWDIEPGHPSPVVDDGKRTGKWKCSECSAVYNRRHSLNHHMREKHKRAIQSDCPDCDSTFLTNRQLIQHGISVHQKYFAYEHKVFKRKILESRRSDDEEDRIKNFECDICQRRYVCKNSLKRHILKTHLGKGHVETAVCPYCGKTLSNKLNLKSHIEFVHEALFVSCPVCKKRINFKTIGKHYKTHQTSSDFSTTGSSEFLCNLCGKILKSKRGFDDHQKLHKNIRDQLCDICGSGFTTKKFLYLHKKIHEGIKRKVFGCSQCDKVFSGRHTLNRHLLTHSGEKNFICEICSKCFYTLQELNRHVRYHKKEYRFDCPLCEMRFLDKSRFRHHMMRHRNIRPHKCPFCDKMFIVRRKMNLHMAAKHNVEVKSTKGIWKDPKTYIPLDDLL